jgi:hypothetical protein
MIEVILSNSPLVALVDDEDWPRICSWTWKLVGAGYVARKTTGPGRVCRCIYLARFLLGLDFGDPREAEHKNRIKIDCQKGNLRIATRIQNIANTGKRQPTKCSSIFRGVSFQAACVPHPWRAKLTNNGITHNLGYFLTEIEAAVAWNYKALECWGEFACLNPV